MEASICSHNMFEEINAGFQQLFRVLRNPLYLGRENVRKQSEKQERVKTERNEKHALRTGVALAAIAYMLSVCRRESLVPVPSF